MDQTQLDFEIKHLYRQLSGLLNKEKNPYFPSQTCRAQFQYDTLKSYLNQSRTQHIFIRNTLPNFEKLLNYN